MMMITQICWSELEGDYSLFPHGNYSLSCQTLLNPEDNMFCRDPPLINEKGLDGAGFRPVG